MATVCGEASRLGLRGRNGDLAQSEQGGSRRERQRRARGVVEGKLRAALDKVRALEGGGATRPPSRSIGAQIGEVSTSLRAEAWDFVPAVQTV